MAAGSGRNRTPDDSCRTSLEHKIAMHLDNSVARPVCKLARYGRLSGLNLSKMAGYTAAAACGAVATFAITATVSAA
jgi:hypothetical protein